MKDWKEEMLSSLETEAETLKEIRFHDVAASHGYSHIKTQDVRDIMDAFCKKHPEYRPVLMLDYEGQNASLFTHGVLTMCEYDNAGVTNA